MDGVVDQDVEPPLLALDALEQGLHLTVVGMVAVHRDALSAGRGDGGGAGVDGAVQHFVANPAAALGGAAPGHVDGHAGGAERFGHALAHAAAGAGDDRHPWRYGSAH